MTKADEAPKGLPGLRDKRKDNAELQPVSKQKVKNGYVQ